MRWARYGTNGSCLGQCFLNFIAHGPLLAKNNNTDPQTLAHVNIQCPGDRYPKLKTCVSEMIFDS